jgi:hypothetical protein
MLQKHINFQVFAKGKVVPVRAVKLYGELEI